MLVRVNRLMLSHWKLQNASSPWYIIGVRYVLFCEPRSFALWLWARCHEWHHHVRVAALLLFSIIFSRLITSNSLSLLKFSNGHFKQFFNYPSPHETGIIVAILEIAAMGESLTIINSREKEPVLLSSYSVHSQLSQLATSLCAGQLGDIYGRRLTLLFGACLFSIGGLLQTVANGLTWMLVGRVISGLGVGMLTWVFKFLTLIKHQIEAV